MVLAPNSNANLEFSSISDMSPSPATRFERRWSVYARRITIPCLKECESAAHMYGVGCYGASRIWCLKQFDHYCSHHSLVNLDGRRATAGWQSSNHFSPTLARGRPPYESSAGGRESTATSMLTCCRISGRPASSGRSPTNTNTNTDIRLLFQAASRVESSSPWTWQAVAFFALMPSCGLRTGEVRHLTPHDVHPHDGVIEVIEVIERAAPLPWTC